ncbi:MAG: gliding motility-associated C-terminal domain-containing protein, partial [Bacteroidota bacterium]
KLPGQIYSFANEQFKEEGEYIVHIDNPNRCDSTIFLFIENIKIFIPNIFSPNGDNINDNFEVYLSDPNFAMMEMQIFDRWGNLLFKGEKWDGRSNNKLASSGVYVYVVKLMASGDEEMIITNSVTLVR